jgi:hypothetical protein
MMRLISELDTSGKVTGMKSNEPSSNGGINSLPNRITSGILPASIKKQMSSVLFFHFKHPRRTGAYRKIKNLDTGCLLSGLTFPFSKTTISTGTSIMATNAEPIMAKVFVHTSGAKSLCSWPVKNRMGLNETNVTRMELTTAFPIIFEEDSIFCSRSCLVSIQTV